MSEVISDEELISKASIYCEQLKSRLKNYIPPKENRAGGKQLHMFDSFSAISAHRIHDLSDAALGLFRQQRLVPATTLTRAVIESVAILFYALKKVKAAIEEKEIDTILEFIHRAIRGSRNSSSGVTSIQVLTALDHMDKAYPKTRSEYDVLCEIAHPNLYGGAAAYSKFDKQTFSIKLGNNPDGLPLSAFGLGQLRIYLEIALQLYSDWESIRTEYVDLINNLAPGRYID